MEIMIRHIPLKTKRENANGSEVTMASEKMASERMTKPPATAITINTISGGLAILFSTEFPMDSREFRPQVSIEFMVSFPHSGDCPFSSYLPICRQNRQEAGSIVQLCDCCSLEPIDLITHTAVDGQSIEIISIHVVLESLSLTDSVYRIICADPDASKVEYLRVPQIVHPPV